MNLWLWLVLRCIISMYFIRSSWSMAYPNNVPFLLKLAKAEFLSLLIMVALYICIILFFSNTEISAVIHLLQTRKLRLREDKWLSKVKPLINGGTRMECASRLFIPASPFHPSRSCLFILFTSFPSSNFSWSIRLQSFFQESPWFQGLGECFHLMLQSVCSPMIMICISLYSECLSSSPYVPLYCKLSKSRRGLFSIFVSHTRNSPWQKVHKHFLKLIK